MNGYKSFLGSTTIWGAGIAIASAVLAAFGYSIGAEDQVTIVGWVANLAGMAGGVLAIYGRVKATKKIG
jgi:hypothetical protein